VNREDILKMEAGREMDELILVHIFGYTKLPFPAMPEFQKPAENGVYATYHVNRYSTDIKSAWDVAEKNRGDAFALLKSPIYGGYFFTYKHERAFGETAPLAICRAALLAVMA
jgi:hypothetical protein